MSEREELFDPEFLGRLRTLFFKLRKRRQLQRKGIHQMPSGGQSREFRDHRQYSPGDDFRAIDWRLLARLDREFVRVYEDVQEYHVHILVDRSRSMIEPHGEKRVATLRLALALAYLALQGQHRVSLITLNDQLRREFRPLKGQGHVHQLMKPLAELSFTGATDLVGTLSQFRPGRDRKGMVFVISDLFGRSPELSAEAISQATRWPAETHVIHVMHPTESRPQMQGEVRLVDVETGEARRVFLTKRELARYAREFEKYQEELARECVKRQINYFPWLTDRPFEDLFLDLLSRGSSLAETGGS